MTEPLTCADVQAFDLVTRYAAGTLPQPEAERFEAHYLECERCWEDLQAALAAREILAPTEAPHAAPSTSSFAWSRRRVLWVSLAAAAALLVGVRLWEPWSRASNVPVLRGSEDVTVTCAWRSDGSLVVTWPRVPGAARYRVHLIGVTSQPTRQTIAPPLVIAATELGAAGQLTITLDVENDAGETIRRGQSGPVRRASP